MRKLATAVLASSLTFAAAPAFAFGDGDTVAPGGDASTQTYTATTLYVQEDFDFNLSPSVGIGVNEVQSMIGVATIHSDGRFHFGGSSEGGAVTNCETTALDPATTKTIAAPSDPANGCADYS